MKNWTRRFAIAPSYVDVSIVICKHEKTPLTDRSERLAGKDSLLQFEDCASGRGSAEACNLLCLPENYQMKYYFYHMLSWPQLLYVPPLTQHSG